MNRNVKRRMKIRELQLDIRLMRDENLSLRREVLLLSEQNDSLLDDVKRLRAIAYGPIDHQLDMEDLAAE